MKSEGPLANDWSLSDGKGYILNHDRSHAAASRLNLQFYLWKDALKYNIHPSIQPSLVPNALIADVASGSGMWLIDVSRQLPDAQLDGFDLVLRQVPHRKWLPANINFRFWNILEEIPDDLVGKYDYMLKPGGHLQWDELDTVNMCIKKVDRNLQTPALDRLREWSWADGRHDWTIELPRFLAEEGFRDAGIDFVGDGTEMARAFTEQHLLTAEEFAQGLVKLGKEEAAGNYLRLVQEAYEEEVAGAALCVPRVVCVARKPLSV